MFRKNRGLTHFEFRLEGSLSGSIRLVRQDIYVQSTNPRSEPQRNSDSDSTTLAPHKSWKSMQRIEDTSDFGRQVGWSTSPFGQVSIGVRGNRIYATMLGKLM